jgi:hypothetical protein
MVQEAKGNVSGKNKGMVFELAALTYYDSAAPEPGKPLVQFEQLSEAEQKPWIQGAAKVLARLDKLNLAVVPRVAQAEREAKDRKNVEKLTEIIRSFNLKVRVFKRELYPCAELAHQIYSGGK